MITSFQIYWLLMLDNISMFFTFVSAISIIAIVFMFFGKLFDFQLERDREKKAFTKTTIVFLVFSMVTALIAIFTPNTRQMAAIIVAPAIINNKDVQQIPKRLLDVLGLSLDKLEKELSK